MKLTGELALRLSIHDPEDKEIVRRLRQVKAVRLSQLTGISDASISKWLSGVMGMSWDRSRRLLKVIGMWPDRLDAVTQALKDQKLID